MAEQTPYVETEALLAVMNEDDGRAEELLGEMHEGELVTFARQLHELGLMVANATRDAARDRRAGRA